MPASPLPTDNCDTLPVPHNIRITRNFFPRSPSPITAQTRSSAFDVPTAEEVQATDEPEYPPSPKIDADTQPPARKLCVRHQRMADEGTNLKLQQSLDALPLQEREAANSIWSTFSSSSHPQRATILQGLLTMCCRSQLSFLSDQLVQLNRIDPVSILPREIVLRVLGYLDAISLCRAAQVNSKWLALADDDVLWRNICEQHIGQKCHTCGWGLPMLERRRKMRLPASPLPYGTASTKRDLEDMMAHEHRPLKRQRSESSEFPTANPSSSSLPSPVTTPASSRSLSPAIHPGCSSPRTVTRPWKDVYSERLTIERNWRRGRCTVRTLKGHTDGIMCLQFTETLQHPSFPVLITGSYDRTARVWNLESGEEVRCLRGHSRAVRALQFDEAKLITASMDHTMRVWNWRTGRCIRTLEGHTEGVVCLNFDSNVLASGSVDTTVKVWNFRNGECFTLRGHMDWVNSVQLWDSMGTGTSVSPTCCTSTLDHTNGSVGEPSSAPTIDPGKMLFSASDDGTILLWDLNMRTSVRRFTGHVGQVQSIKLLLVDPPCHDDDVSTQRPITPTQTTRDPRSNLPSGLPGFAPASVSIPSPPPPEHPGHGSPEFTPPVGFNPFAYRFNPSADPGAHVFPHDAQLPLRTPSPQLKKSPNPVLISGSLDNTIRVWDVETGKAISTLFGHIEGVWAVASDNLRLISGSHDRTIKVWVREEGRCMATLVGHRGAVTCLSLGDDKIVSGSDDGDIRVWSFAE